jgi:hypothetical protein
MLAWCLVGAHMRVKTIAAAKEYFPLLIEKKYWWDNKLVLDNPITVDTV